MLHPPPQRSATTDESDARRRRLLTCSHILSRLDATTSGLPVREAAHLSASNSRSATRRRSAKCESGFHATRSRSRPAITMTGTSLAATCASSCTRMASSSSAVSSAASAGESNTLVFFPAPVTKAPATSSGRNNREGVAERPTRSANRSNRRSSSRSTRASGALDLAIRRRMAIVPASRRRSINELNPAPRNNSQRPGEPEKAYAPGRRTRTTGAAGCDPPAGTGRGRGGARPIPRAARSCGKPSRRPEEGRAADPVIRRRPKRPAGR
jgi:hypothetical protein